MWSQKILVLGTLALAGQAAAKTWCTRPLKMGWEPWAPYSMLEGQTHTGIDLDLATEILKGMGCKINFIHMPWVRLIHEIETGGMDIVGGAAKTPEREGFSYISGEGRRDSMAFFLRTGEDAKFKIAKLEDMIGTNFRLGVTRGYDISAEFQELKKKPEFAKLLNESSHDSHLLQKLVSHRIDGFIANPLNVEFEKNKMGLSAKISKPIFPIGTEDPAYYLLSKASGAFSPEFLVAFNDELAKLKSSGRYDKIVSANLAKGTLKKK